MMDYVQRPQTYTGSVSSSVDTISGTGSGSVSAGDRRCSHPRVRTVRLTRPHMSSTPSPLLTCGRQGPGFGFSLRGGREHGTGFFVSSIDLGSEAHIQGLKVGDQILRINGFTVDDAIHKEILQLISNHTHLTLKVRNVGMIPVKEKSSDPLGWQIIQDSMSISSSSPPLSDKHREARISISVAPRSKLGCGICKGPEWKPGIFVQFTKDGGISREAGLRPGDQILFCNGVDFNDLPFNEAVNVLKNSHQLDLLVRKGAGLELFPGESSGYNSSASSVTGDQSPSWSDSKRLSIVKEETLELEDRLSQLDLRYKSNRWTGDNWDSQSNDSGGDHARATNCKPTIINLSENGTTIKNNGAAEELCQSNELNNASSKLHQHETKTVVVEVHRSETEDEDVKENKGTIDKSPSTSSLTSFASSTASSSLSSAISQELMRRSERNKDVDKNMMIESELQKKKLIKNVDVDMKHKHDKLMDEFKKAHRKMFASTLSQDEIKEATETNNDTLEKDREKQTSTTNSPQLRHNASPATSNPAVPPPPPPPPPMPSSNSTNENVMYDSNTLKQASKKPKAPPVPQKTYKKEQILPPPCPTPDYDNLSLNSVIITNSETLKRNPQASTLGKRSGSNCVNDAVEMESLESFKLNNPSGPRPKPPNTYFERPRQKLSSQSSIGSVSSIDSVTSVGTMRKLPRPVSVTIGEYPSGLQRRQPSKFEFLSQSKSCDYDQRDGVREQNITSRLASELTQTLSRSNLKTKTEMENSKQQNGLIINVNNGNNTTNSNNSMNGMVLHKPLSKSQSTNELSSKHIENMTNSLSNRLTIRISDNDQGKKVDSSPPNGILKNGNAQP